MHKYLIFKKENHPTYNLHITLGSNRHFINYYSLATNKLTTDQVSDIQPFKTLAIINV